MPTIDFSAKELASLKAHYASEHQRLTVQLSHVESMIQKLGGNVAKTSKKSKSTLTAKGVPAKKRGPKSIWGAFIQKRLRARNRPMTYEELIDDMKAFYGMNQKFMREHEDISIGWRIKILTQLYEESKYRPELIQGT